MSQYDMGLVYSALAQNASETRAAITPAFINFLGTPGCSLLMASLRLLVKVEEAKPAMLGPW